MMQQGHDMLRLADKVGLLDRSARRLDALADDHDVRIAWLEMAEHLSSGITLPPISAPWLRRG